MTSTSPQWAIGPGALPKPTLTFSDVLTALRYGKRARRDSWYNVEVYVYLNGTLKIHWDKEDNGPTEHDWIIQEVDLLADDWSLA